MHTRLLVAQVPTAGTGSPGFQRPIGAVVRRAGLDGAVHQSKGVSTGKIAERQAPIVAGAMHPRKKTGRDPRGLSIRARSRPVGFPRYSASSAGSTSAMNNSTGAVSGKPWNASWK